MSVYAELLHAAQCGRKYRINLKEKTLKIDNHEINLENDLIEPSDLYELGLEETDPWKILEELYFRYKKSVPSAHYNGNKPYFHADNAEDLTDDEIAFNESRETCQAVLEGYVLLAGLNGTLVWQIDNHWFWQSELYKECVVLKEWIM